MAQLPWFLKWIRPMSDSVNTFAPVPSPTQEKITNMSSAPEPQAQKLTREDLFWDAKKIIEAKWIDKQQALTETLKYYKAKWLEVEGVDIDAELWLELEEEAPEVIEETFDIQEAPVVRQAEDVVWGAVANIPSMIGNTFGFLADVVTPEKFEWLWDVFREQWIQDKAALQEILWVDPDSFSTKAWEFGSEIGSLFIPWGQSKLISKFPWAADKIADLRKAVDTLWQKSPKIFNALKSAATWAKDVGKFEVVSEWEVTPEGLAVWAVANPLIGKTIKWIGKVSGKVAEKLEVMGLLNPSKLDTVTRQLWTWDTTAVADFLLKNDVKWSKASIINQLQSIWSKSKNKVDDALLKVKDVASEKTSDDALKILLEQVDWKTGLEDDALRFTGLLKKNQETWLTLTERNEIKRWIDEFLTLFTQKWEVMAGTTKKWATNVRSALQKNIEQDAKKAWIDNIKALNKNTQVSFTLKDAIQRKDSADQARELLTAFAPWWLWAVWWALQPWDDPFDRLKNIVIWAAVWQVAWSTTVKTNVAALLNKLSWLQRESLLRYIETGWATPISSEIIELITE